MKVIRLFIVLLVVLIGYPATVSSTKKAFIKKEQWSKHSGKYNYSEHYKTMQYKPKPVNPGFITAAWLKFVLWIIIIALIVVALVYLILSINKNLNYKVVKERIRSAEVIENIEETDLEYLLEQALAAGMYKEAVRFRYLILIRQLNRLNLIAWKKDKTNGIYIREMFNKPGFDIFRQLTIHFERVWYGDQVISAEQYNALIPSYKHMNEIAGVDSAIASKEE